MTMGRIKATVRLCVTVVSLMAIVLLFVAGSVAVDTVSGRMLHGNDYRTDLSVDVETTFLPMRWRVLWGLVDGVADGCFESMCA